MFRASISGKTELTTPDTKIALRSHFRQRRNAYVASLAPPVRARLETQLATIVAPLTATARVPASYAAQGAEIDPAAIEKNLPNHAFPRVSGKNLYFHIADWADLVPGALGIPEPSANSPQVTPDLLLVPLLAVTPAGIRLGQGGGFYDRTLVALRSRGPVLAIGLAWDVQVTETLPRDPWDELLDFVATPSRLVDCTHNR